MVLILTMDSSADVQMRGYADVQMKKNYYLLYNLKEINIRLNHSLNH